MTPPLILTNAKPKTAIILSLRRKPFKSESIYDTYPEFPKSKDEAVAKLAELKESGEAVTIGYLMVLNEQATQ